MKDINRYLDHAVLKPDLTLKEAKQAILAGVKYNVRTVCVRPCDISMAIELCKDTETGVCAVLGFPHGCISTASKVQEAILYADQGVDEVDMVANYAWIRSGNWDAFKDEVMAVKDALNGICLKVIFETGVLDDEDQIKQATHLCIQAGADYVKTSTGFNGGGATIDVVKAMIDAAEGRILVKPSGGIRDLAAAEAFVKMGAARLGVGYTTTPVLCGDESQDSTVGY